MEYSWKTHGISLQQFGRHPDLLPQQFGFRPSRSTVDPLSILEHVIQKAYELQKVTLVILLDLSATFDRASSGAVLSKLTGMRVEGDIFRWLHN